MATLKYKDAQGNIKTARLAVTTVDWLKYASSVTFDATFPTEEVTVHLEGCTTLANAFRYSDGVKNLTVYVGQPTSLLRFVSSSPSITKVKIIGDLSACTTYKYCFNFENIEEIDADIDFTSVTSSATTEMLQDESSTLTKARFVANTLSVSMVLYSSVLNDESLISLANACKTGVSETLSWSDESKTRASLIMGKVSQVTEGDVTYDFFTADESGTVTLMSFITQTKGWTLA